jgi:thiol-disulfide isomerase/thioredoxin
LADNGRIISKVSASQQVFVVLLCSLLVGASCEPRESRPAGARVDSGTGPIQLNLIDPAGLQKVVEGFRGNVVFIDFWATWCAPCVRQFPHTLALHKVYREDGLKVVGVSLDDPSNAKAVLEFLHTYAADFNNYISADGATPASFEGFQIEDGSLPHYVLYDRAGEARYTYRDEPQGVEKDIQELLAEEP